jgi:hypothetical protein
MKSRCSSELVPKTGTSADPARVYPEDISFGALRVLHRWSGYPVLCELMEGYGTLEVFLAGGAVRDVILGRQPKDLDFFIDGLDLARVLRVLQQRGNVTYGPFGSPRWFPRGQNTYVDVIHIKSFYNGLSDCHSMLDALLQFDFTANAVATNLRTGALLDPLQGILDIRARTMRAVRFDYPDEPISADLRISRLSVLWFRLLHYAATCGLHIEPATFEWLSEHRNYRRDLKTFMTVFFTPDRRSLFIYDTAKVEPR